MSSCNVTLGGVRVQRHALVADVLQQCKAGKVIDLGCGEGKLLEHFIRSQDCTSAHTLVRPLLCEHMIDM